MKFMVFLVGWLQQCRLMFIFCLRLLRSCGAFTEKYFSALSMLVCSRPSMRVIHGWDLLPDVFFVEGSFWQIDLFFATEGQFLTTGRILAVWSKLYWLGVIGMLRTSK